MMKLTDISFKVILIGIAAIALLLLIFIAGNYQYLLKNPLTSTTRVLQSTTMPAKISSPAITASKKADVLNEKIQTWLPYSDPKGYFPLTYPSFFTVENRGKIGDVDEVVAFNYTNPANSVRLSILRFEVSSKPIPKQTAGINGQDRDGNK